MVADNRLSPMSQFPPNSPMRAVRTARRGANVRTGGRTGLNDGMPTRVLITEDDAGIRLVLKTVLEDEGHEVVDVETGEQALSLGTSQDFDIALVDLRLPGIHGLDVVRSLRGHSQIPIVIITANSDSHDVVAGLEAGADDYIVKPFVGKEVAARVRALLRRAGTVARPDGTIIVGDIEIRPATAEVLLHQEVVPMSRTEFLVMQELGQARGSVLGRNDLLNKVWGYGGVGDGRVVDNVMYRLRAKLEVDPANPRRIVTSRGFGYRLQA